jgi:hypothetical protein
LAKPHEQSQAARDGQAEITAILKKPVPSVASQENAESVTRIAFGFLRVYRKLADGILYLEDHEIMMSPRIEVHEICISLPYILN